MNETFANSNSFYFTHVIEHDSIKYYEYVSPLPDPGFVKWTATGSSCFLVLRSEGGFEWFPSSNDARYTLYERPALFCADRDRGAGHFAFYILVSTLSYLISRVSCRSVFLVRSTRFRV